MNPHELQRVVTGVNADGRSAVVRRGASPTVAFPGDSPRAWVSEIWVGDTVPADLADDRDLAERDWRLEPPPDGAAFRLFQLPPRSEGGSDSGMHVTSSVDCVVVLSGRVWLVLEEDEVELGPGDSVVQRGTVHDWQNRGDEPCVVAAVLVSARDGSDGS